MWYCLGIMVGWRVIVTLLSSELSGDRSIMEV